MLSPKVLLVFCGLLALGTAYQYFPYAYQSNQVYPYQNAGYKPSYQNFANYGFQPYQYHNYGYQPYQNYFGYQPYQNHFGYQPYQNQFGYQPYQNHFGYGQVPFGSVNADRFDWEAFVRSLIPLVTTVIDKVA